MQCSKRYSFHTFISLTEKGISHVKFGKAVTRNNEFIVAVVTMGLRSEQQIYSQKSLHNIS